MKIALIGPTYPFRGGIAHHTTLLCAALRKKHDVKFFTFKRQYPQWLFPGRTDKELSPLVAEPGDSEPVLDSLFPTTWWRCAASVRRCHPDLVVFPWWVIFHAPAFRSIIRSVKKDKDVRVLALCHNVEEHERRAFGRAVARHVLGLADGVLAHSRRDAETLRALLPKAAVRTAFLPPFRPAEAPSISRDEAKRKLGIEGNVLLFFGFVRPYKGLSHLLDALPLVLRSVPAHLLVVGEFWKGKETALEQINRMKISDNVTIIDRYVANEDVPDYFAAADLVVLPYVKASQSGIVPMANCFGRAVVATSVGGLPDAVDDGATGYLVPPEHPQELANAIVRFFKEDKQTEFERAAVARAGQQSWDKYVEILIELANEVTQGSTGSAQ